MQRSYDGPTKAGDVRYLPILDALLPVLHEVVGALDPMAIVFPNESGEMLGRSARAFQEILHRVLRDAGFTRTRLVPWLRRGDVVIMDNLNMHKMVAVRAAITAAGATPIYLPTYSPELNPIELLWADIKRALRSLALNLESELLDAVRRLRRRVALTKIAGWFRRAFSEAQLNGSRR